MSPNIMQNVEYLLEDEVDYELQIRKEPVIGDLNDKRRTLRRSFNNERKDPFLFPRFWEANSESEMQICTPKLEEVRVLMGTEKVNTDKVGRCRAFTRLIHLKHRLNRIITPDEKNEQDIHGLLQTIATLLQENFPDKRTSITTNARTPEASENESTSEGSETNLSVAKHLKSSRNMSDINHYDWKFSGKHSLGKSKLNYLDQHNLPVGNTMGCEDFRRLSQTLTDWQRVSNEEKLVSREMAQMRLAQEQSSFGASNTVHFHQQPPGTQYALVSGPQSEHPLNRTAEPIKVQTRSSQRIVQPMQSAQYPFQRPIIQTPQQPIQPKPQPSFQQQLHEPTHQSSQPPYQQPMPQPLFRYSQPPMNNSIPINPAGGIPNHDRQYPPVNQNHTFYNPNGYDLQYPPVHPYYEYAPKPRGLPINRWGLTFTGEGKSKDKDLLNFLARVNLLARSEGMSNVDLLRQAYHLFDGAARDWDVAFHTDFNSWEELVFELKQNYLQSNNDVVIRKEIERRLQRQNEPFITYMSEMELMFQKLSYRMPEQEKLSILRENLHPYFSEKLVIMEIPTIDDLKRYCRKIETLNTRSSIRNETTGRHAQIHELYEEPEICAVRNFNDRKPHRNGQMEVLNSNQQTLQPAVTSSNRTMTCHNCHKPGHQVGNCPMPRRTYSCHRCGQPGVTLYKCPKCNPK
jgi:hypothetical protein